MDPDKNKTPPAPPPPQSCLNHSTVQTTNITDLAPFFLPLAMNHRDTQSVSHVCEPASRLPMARVFPPREESVSPSLLNRLSTGRTHRAPDPDAVAQAASAPRSLRRWESCQTAPSQQLRVQPCAKCFSHNPPHAQLPRRGHHGPGHGGEPGSGSGGSLAAVTASWTRLQSRIFYCPARKMFQCRGCLRTLH